MSIITPGATPKVIISAKESNCLPNSPLIFNALATKPSKKSNINPLKIANGARSILPEKANKIETKLIICPYGHVGDVLWVREAFAHTKQLNLAPDDENYGFVYKAEDESILWNDIEGWRWRPSIHMPIEACRSWCVVTGIECQQLQDITGEDAIGEGIKWDGNLAYPAFHTLWVNINGLESWKANPWVWVVRYEHTTIPPAGWDEHVKAVTAKRRSK